MVELKEEMLEEVPALAKLREFERRWALVVIAVSESEGLDELEADFGGDGSSSGSMVRETRSYGLRVRRMGPLLSILFVENPSFVFFGRVRAQFSHGIALFLSFSSYVFRKLESRLWLFKS